MGLRHKYNESLPDGDLIMMRTICAGHRSFNFAMVAQLTVIYRAKA